MDPVDLTPCLTWVKRGVSVPKIKKVKPSKQEVDRVEKEISKQAQLAAEPSSSGEHSSRTSFETDDEAQEHRDIDALYKMDSYSTDLEQPIASYTISDDSSSDSDPEDWDDFVVKPNENLLVAGRVQKELSTLEIHAFNNDAAQFFILHDILLPSYPICMSFVGYNPEKKPDFGNFVAVGYFTPSIDIWDLNVCGMLEPHVKLKGKKNDIKHEDAVLDICWNKQLENTLASGSADHSVVLWDLNAAKGVQKLKSFSEKVQSLQWHPAEAQTILAGSCEGKARLFDLRINNSFKTWLFEGEVERVVWNKFNPYYFFVSTEVGEVHCVDARNKGNVWTMNAHTASVTGLCLSELCRDFLVTASTDGSIKIWDLDRKTPELVTTKNPDIGKIYSLAACPDVPYVFCAGGSKKGSHMYLWDTRESQEVLDHFKPRKKQNAVFDETTSCKYSFVEKPSTSKSNI